MNNREARVRIGRILNAYIGMEPYKPVIPHIINEIMTDLGVADWPIKDEVITESDPVNLTGFEIISEMTKQQLIDECLAFQIKLWQQMPERALRQMVVTARTNDYLGRLKKEAGIDDGHSGFTQVLH